MTAYELYPVDQNQIRTTNVTVPANARYMLVSFWGNIVDSGDFGQFQFYASSESGTFWDVEITGAAQGNNTIGFAITVREGGTSEYGLQAVTYNVPYTPGVLHNFTISLDMVGILVGETMTGIAQVYMDGVAIPPFSASGSSIITGGPVGQLYWMGLLENAGMANLYLDFPSTFFDLSVPANVAKFVSGRAPVYLGANGELPTGVEPLIFLTSAGASPNDILTNVGSGGGTFAPQFGPLAWLPYVKSITGALAQSITSNEFMLSWNPVVPGVGETVTGYNVTYSVQGQAAYTTVNVPSGTEVTITGLAASTIYDVYVSVLGTGVSGSSATISFESASAGPYNGTPGPANRASFTSAPTLGLCTYGLPSEVTGSGPWVWTCKGAHGGGTASCEALVS